ncbi:hypothetical protein S83_058868, partial [Arachis hypogaea]
FVAAHLIAIIHLCTIASNTIVAAFYDLIFNLAHLLTSASNAVVAAFSKLLQFGFTISVTSNSTTQHFTFSSKQVTNSVCNVFVPHQREKLMDSVCSEFQGKLNILFQYFLNDPLNYDLKYYVSAQPFLVFDLLEAYSRGFIRLFILPNLEPYLLLLEPEMQPEKQRNETKRQEAWQVYGALLCAVGQCMHERAKIFSNLLSPPTRASSRPNGKAMIAIS